MAPSWAVVATVDEPAPLVGAFVAHHLAQGAAEVHLFLDDPNEEVEALVMNQPGCIVTRCTRKYWNGSELGRKPILHTRRQNINANVAYGRCKADWLLHCDADEFVRDGAALAQELARAGPDDRHLRLAVAERVMPAGQEQIGLFDGFFRKPARGVQPMLDEIYEPVSRFLDEGMTGHPNGKALTRIGCGLQLGIHQPLGAIPSQLLWKTRLLHFDGLTPFHYMIKLLRRAYEKETSGTPRHKPGRMTQLMAMKENLADAEFRDEMVKALKTLRPDQVSRLDALDLLDHRPFVPSVDGMGFDLSVASFDATLRARFAPFLADIASKDPLQQ